MPARLREATSDPHATQDEIIKALDHWEVVISKIKGEVLERTPYEPFEKHKPATRKKMYKIIEYRKQGIPVAIIAKTLRLSVQRVYALLKVIKNAKLLP